jgi:hypothetical protein
MTLNEIIGNSEKKSKIDTELWKKINEKYDNIQNNPIKDIETQVPIEQEEIKVEEIDEEKKEGILTYSKKNIKIYLKSLKKNTCINIKTQKEYDNLMQIYHTAKWYWHNYHIRYPVFVNAWPEYKDKTCITTKTNWLEDKEPILSFEKKENRLWKISARIQGYKIITLEEFYKKQDITPKIIEILNDYYDTNYDFRPSKG